MYLVGASEAAEPRDGRRDEMRGSRGGGGRGRKKRSYLVDASEMTEFQGGGKKRGQRAEREREEKRAVGSGWMGKGTRWRILNGRERERRAERDGERWNVVG